MRWLLVIKLIFPVYNHDAETNLMSARIFFSFNPFNTKKQTTKFTSANFGKKVSSISYIILRIQRLEGNSIEPDEVGHDEPPHQDQPCLKVQLFLSLWCLKC